MNQLQVLAQVVAMVRAVPHQVWTNDWGMLIERTYGFKFLGAGQGSCTLEHPYNPGLVVKITKNMEDGSLDYMTYVHKHQQQGINSPHWPEIHAMHLEEGKFMVVIMERLHPDHCNDPDLLEDFWEWRMSGNIPSKFDPVLTKMASDFGKPDDLYPSNVMFRNGVPVLTDPYYRIYSDKREELKYRQYFRNGKLDVTVRLVRHEDAGHSLGDILAAALKEPRLGALEQREMARAFLLPPGLMGRVRVDHNLELHRKEIHAIRGAKFDTRAIKAVELLAQKIGAHFDKQFMEAAVGRPVVADAGQGIAVRGKEENHLLRWDTKHDRIPRSAGFPGALLSERGSRRLRSSWPAKPEGFAGEAGIAAGANRRADQLAPRLHARYPARRAGVVAEVRDWRGAGPEERVRIQPP